LHLHQWSVVTTPYPHVDGTKPHGGGLIGGMAQNHHRGNSSSPCVQYLYPLAYGNEVKHSRYHQRINLEYQQHRQVSYQTVLHGRGIAIIQLST
jgi:hypothetical protein